MLYVSAAIEVNSSVFWIITRRKVVWNWRFGTTYRSHLQGQAVRERRDLKRGFIKEKVVGGDGYSENVTLANRISGVWRTWKGESEMPYAS
jgi:hypothetical protein